MRKQSIVAMALAVAVLAGVGGHGPFTEVPKAEASTQMGQYGYTAEEQEFLKALNMLRKNVGVPFDLKLDPRLNATSMGHAKYVDIHGNTHVQEAGKKGFTGVNYTDRAKAQGYNIGVMEVISNVPYGKLDIQTSINGLLGSPKHRSNLIAPHYQEVGVGKTTRSLVALFSEGNITSSHELWDYDYKPVAYPYNGQTGVPLKLDKNTLFYDPSGVGATEMGYAISVYVPYRNRDIPGNIELYDSKGNRVEVHGSQTKALSSNNLIYVVSKKPFKPGETYKAKATFAGGSFDKYTSLEWSFTTAKFDASAFPDYNSSAYWAKTFEWAINNNIIYGGLRNGKTYLDPDVNLTETQMLSVFFRYFKPVELTSTPTSSTWGHDVNYQLATKYGLPVKASNTSNTSRNLADAPITRGQFAQVMATMHHGKSMSEKESVEFLIKVGLSAQKNYADYLPNMTLSRAHAVTFLQRYNEIFNNGK